MRLKHLGGAVDVYQVVVAASRVLRSAGLHDEAERFIREATSCESHDAVLGLVMATVEVS